MAAKWKILFSIICSLFSFLLFAQDTVQVSLNLSNPGRKIPSDFTGLSFETNSFNRGYFGANRDTLINLFQTLGVKVLRLGGNSVEQDTFTFAQASTPNHTDTITTADIDTFFAFINKAGCKVIFGLNFGGDFDPSLSASEANYVYQNYDSLLTGFEVGNEPDLYFFDGLRPSSYTYPDFEDQWLQYFDSIRYYDPNAPFTGPATFFNLSGYTVPFCNDMSGKITVLTHHYYVGPANSGSTSQQIINLLSPSNLNTVTTEVNELVSCSDSSSIPFRIAETNSFYNGGQWGVSDAFASALWALDYMHAVAEVGCAGVNFHGALSGPYTVVAENNNLYSARPIYYGILAFQLGSHGNIIPITLTNGSLNLDAYAVIDSMSNVFVTIINKDTLQNALLNLDAGAIIDTATYVSLLSPAVSDTDSVTLAGQVVQPDGTFPLIAWQPLSISGTKIHLNIPAASAMIIKLHADTATGLSQVRKAISNSLNIYPDPTSGILYIETAMEQPFTIKVMDMEGKVITNYTSDDKSTIFNTSSLAKGMYLVELKEQDGTLVRNRFVKQ